MSFSFDVNNRPIVERAGLAPAQIPPHRAFKKTRTCKNAKSKTGCTTCKSRRVKCDETKPACNRCKNFGRKCDGYNYQPKDKLDEPWLRGPTLSVGIARPHAPHALKLSPNISTFTLPDQREHSYFLYFCEKTVYELAGGYQKKLWNVIVLQACNNHPAVRHAAVALAALSKAIRVPYSRPDGDYSVQTFSEEAESHHQYALQQFGKALRETIQNGKHAIRTSLIVSLLIYCFENSHGNPQQAGKHIYTALKMMRSDILFTSHPNHNLLMSSPAPRFIEDEIVTTYTRLALNLTTRSDDHDSLRASFLELIMVDVPLPEIPDVFKDVAEAEEHLEYVLYQTLPKTSQSSFTRRSSPVNQYPEGQTNDYSVRSPPRILTTSFDNASFNSLFFKWQTAFKPLLTRALAGSGNFLPAAMLRVKALNVCLMGQGVFLPNNSPTTFLSYFREIISLSQLAVSSPQFLKTFVFDVGIIPSLFAIVYACHDAHIREEAVSILMEMTPRREGTWDSLKVANMAEATMSRESPARRGKFLSPLSPYESDGSLEAESPPFTKSWPQSAISSRPLWEVDRGTRSG